MDNTSSKEHGMICSERNCDNKFIPHYRNGIIISRKCPNCQLKALRKPSNSKSVQLTSDTKTKPNKPEKRKKTKSSIDKRLDTAWSKLVKLKAGNKCVVCGSEKALNSHHIYSRAKMSLRWSLENGICLCVGCHIGSKFSAHKTPIDFNDWLYKNIGVEFMDGLKLMAHTQSNLHEFEKKYLLKELNSEIKKYVP